MVREKSFRMTDGRPGFDLLTLAYFVVFATLLGAGLFVTLFGNPHAEDPVVVLNLSRAVPAARIAAAAAPQAASTATAPATPLQPLPEKPIYAGKALVADPALMEMTPDGPLPRIAADGRTPLSAYAAPAAAGRGPCIAIVMMGLGLSAEATKTALAGLPPQVTLAYSPYANNLQASIDAARQLGHEVLLEVPMEPYDYPQSDPGPDTLRATLGDQVNAAHLAYVLTRATGYVGVTNMLGGRFLANSQAMEPVMTFLSRRGLMFFDDGSAADSTAPVVAQSTGAAFAHSGAIIDSTLDPGQIDRALSDLEARARADGKATATAFVYPITVARIAQWAKGLKGRGFVLVPASAIVLSAK